MKRALCVFLCGLAITTSAQDWKPVGDRIMTRWSRDVRPDSVWTEYPRPQFVRGDWVNLNGLWDAEIAYTREGKPKTFSGRILVPFPVESALSGMGTKVTPDQTLWYRRTFSVPKEWAGKRVMLHFGAVDWEVRVFVNDRLVGQHQGGYDGFGLDITDALATDRENELVVEVWDPTNAGFQPRGKQVSKPGGIWYTAVTGIWQTVWMEPLPESYILSWKAVPDIDQEILDVEVLTRGAGPGDAIEVVVLDKDRVLCRKKEAVGVPFALPISKPKLWSPEDPHLYDAKIVLVRNGRILDEVNSYFGMRKISIRKDDRGVPRLMLNNRFCFMLGTLDQGWWPDGLYEAPTDQALAFDIAETKALGFNTIRKHVKVEPARWYFHCDRLGMLVWQDMPSGDMGSPRGEDEQALRSAQSERQYGMELDAVMRQLINAPSVVVWVPFNEGWGQSKTIEIANRIAHADPSRLVDGTSGWIDFPGAGHIKDRHEYPGPSMPEDKGDNRALVLGEFGGLGLPVAGHTWQEQENWGYRKYQSVAELQNAYLALIDLVPELVRKGLSAAIYTQTTDVEIEVNGLLTYDREVVKMDKAIVRAKNRSLVNIRP